MADVKVRALTRGQKPDFTWANEGDVFTIDAKHFSDRWMKKVSDKDAKAARPKEPEPVKVEVTDPTPVMATNAGTAKA